MARVKRAPHLRALADRVYAAFLRSPQNPRITEVWLLSRYGDPSLTDDALEQLYSQLLKQFGGGGAGGEPPPQKELRRGRDTR
jgi:hypothetical protein